VPCEALRSRFPPNIKTRPWSFFFPDASKLTGNDDEFRKRSVTASLLCTEDKLDMFDGLSARTPVLVELNLAPPGPTGW